MLKRLISWVLASVLGLAAGTGFAAFHLWSISEIYSNADGSVQFIEMTCIAAVNGCNDGEIFRSSAYGLSAAPTGSTFSFPNSTLTSGALNKTLLIATPGFAAIAGVTPDHTIPAGFIAFSGGTVTFTGGAHSVTYTALPGGTQSKDRLGNVGPATPKNYAGVTGTIPPPPDTQAPTVPGTLTATTISSTQINLAWGASTDNVAVTAYRVMRDGVFRITVNAPTVIFSDTGLTDLVTYSYAVHACDAAANCSGPSNTAQATAQNLPDTQAPTVPTGLTANTMSDTRIDLAWTASTDNVGVTQYRVFRNESQIAIVNAPVLKYSSNGLAPTTLYTYNVLACDAALNCSAQSAPASATTLAAGLIAFNPHLVTGFNLIGNSTTTPINVVATFGNQDAPVGGVTANVLAIWRWNAVDQKWAFYSPQMTAAANATFVASKGYELLTSIGQGVGYWVNANTTFDMPIQTGAPFNWGSFSLDAQPSGFNLIAHANERTPSQFNIDTNPTPPPAGQVPTGNFFTLWAWNPTLTTWFYYSPLLESSGGLPAVKAYADSKFYLHFQDYDKHLGPGVGFWINRP